MLSKTLLSDSGSALIYSILILFMMTLIGLTAMNNTDLELNIATNDKIQKMSFFFAESGTQVSYEFVEQGIEERGWSDQSGTNITVDKVSLSNKNFYVNDDLGSKLPDAANRDATVNFGVGTTSLIFGANSALSSGGAIQMVSGYEGKGKGAGSGGAWIIYDIRSQHDGPSNSSSRIYSQWLHLM